MKSIIKYVLGGAFVFSSTFALAVHTIPVNQLTNAGATSAKGMFLFAPDYVEVVPGEGIKFLNSTGNHTVHTIPELWPEGVEPVAISNRPETSVTFEKEGIYGFTCARHGLYGMVMLVKVGNPEGGEKLEKIISTMRASPRKRAALKKLASKHLAN